jgi:nicotinamide-nucleotide amidase
VSHQLFADLIEQLKARGLKLAIAESVTGGMLSSSFVSVEGASKVLLGSVVAYQNSAKHELLGVPLELLDAKGAVSFEVAVSMAEGVRKMFAKTGADLGTLVSVSTTGMASADSSDPKAPPVGLVFVAAQLPGQPAEYLQLSLSGDRDEIRRDAAEQAGLLLQSLMNRN